MDYIWLLPIGHSDYTKRKNIYDLAGSLWEWTNEKVEINSSSWRAYRGGNFVNDGTTYPAAFRDSSDASYTNGCIGFRVRLYIQ